MATTIGYCLCLEVFSFVLWVVAELWSKAPLLAPKGAGLLFSARGVERSAEQRDRVQPHSHQTFRHQCEWTDNL